VWGSVTTRLVVGNCKETSGIDRKNTWDVFRSVDMKRMKDGSTLNVRLDSSEAKVESRRV
jgi:hypothetical protein